MSRATTINVKIQKIFYTYHPDFVQDDNEPRGYRILETGRWVVEWGVRFGKSGALPSGLYQFTADCDTEEDALQFVSMLRRNQAENSPWSIVPKDDICLSSCIYKDGKIIRRSESNA